MKTEDFINLIRPIVYKYGSGWLLDNPEMLEKICKKYHSKQLLIHSVSKSFYCQSDIEMNGICNEQCDHCKEYYKPLEQ